MVDAVSELASLPIIPDTLTTNTFSVISFLMVTASDHPLASCKGNFQEGLGQRTRIVLSIVRARPDAGTA